MGHGRGAVPKWGVKELDVRLSDLRPGSVSSIAAPSTQDSAWHIQSHNRNVLN